MFKTVEEPTKLYHIQDQTDSRQQKIQHCPNMICNQWCVFNLCIYIDKDNIHYIIYKIYNNYSIIPFCSQVGGKDNPAVDPIIHGLRGVVHHGECQSCVKDHGGTELFHFKAVFCSKKCWIIIYFNIYGSHGALLYNMWFQRTSVLQILFLCSVGEKGKLH